MTIWYVVKSTISNTTPKNVFDFFSYGYLHINCKNYIFVILQRITSKYFLIWDYHWNSWSITGCCCCFKTPYRSVPSLEVDESMIGFRVRSSRSISLVTGFMARDPPVRPRLRVLRVLLRCLLFGTLPADLKKLLQIFFLRSKFFLFSSDFIS